MIFINNDVEKAILGNLSTCNFQFLKRTICARFQRRVPIYPVSPASNQHTCGRSLVSSLVSAFHKPASPQTESLQFFSHDQHSWANPAPYSVDMYYCINIGKVKAGKENQIERLTAAASCQLPLEIYVRAVGAETSKVRYDHTSYPQFRILNGSCCRYTHHFFEIGVVT